MKVMLNDVRLSFPSLFEATAFNPSDKPSFSASFIFPKDHPGVKEIKEAIEATGKEKWNDKWDAIKKSLGTDKIPLKDGDTKDYDGYAGNLFISARNYNRPVVVDQDRTPLSEADGKPYAGCYVNASLEFWAQDNNYGKRINCKVRGVQFYKDGDSFGASGSMSGDEFDTFESNNDVAAFI